MKNNNYRRTNRPLRRTAGKRSNAYRNFLYYLKSKAELVIIWILVAFNVILIMSLAQRFIRPPGGAQEIIIREAVAVEVLNGCGERGLAGLFASCLERQKFRILSVGNAPDFDFSRTIMFDRGKRKEDAIRKLQEALGLDSDQVMLVRQDDNQADATLIIGCDYRNLKCYQSE